MFEHIHTLRAEASAIDLLHVFEYPEYIVLDPKGKIIYRGGNNKESLIKALKQLKLI